MYLPEEDDVTGKAIKIDISANDEISLRTENKDLPNLNLNKKLSSEKDNKENYFNNDASLNKNNEKAIPLSINEFYLDQVNSNKNETENNEDFLKRNSTSYGNLMVKEEEDSLIIDFNPDVINPFGTKFSEITKEIKEHSPFRRFETYSVRNSCFIDRL